MATSAIAHRRLDRGRIAQIGLHRVDLADLAERLEVPGQFRPPHRDADAVIALAQRPDHVAPQKAGPAENRDQGFQIRCHVRSSSCEPNATDDAGIWRFRDTPSLPAV